jgi:hypothetical protein
LVCDGSEEFQDAGRGGGEERCVIGRWEYKGVIASSRIGFAAVLNSFPDRLGATADNDREMGEAGGSESRPSSGSYRLALSVGEMNSFAIGALCSNACNA